MTHKQDIQHFKIAKEKCGYLSLFFTSMLLVTGCGPIAFGFLKCLHTISSVRVPI